MNTWQGRGGKKLLFLFFPRTTKSRSTLNTFIYNYRIHKNLASFTFAGWPRNAVLGAGGSSPSRAEPSRAAPSPAALAPRPARCPHWARLCAAAPAARPPSLPQAFPSSLLLLSLGRVSAQPRSRFLCSRSTRLTSPSHPLALPGPGGQCLTAVPSRLRGLSIQIPTVHLRKYSPCKPLNFPAPSSFFNFNLVRVLFNPTLHFRIQFVWKTLHKIKFYCIIC